MSTTIQDLKGGESNCCGAKIYANGMCEACLEHCSNVECVCLERLKKDTGLENFITVPHYADCPVLAEELANQNQND